MQNATVCNDGCFYKTSDSEYNYTFWSHFSWEYRHNMTVIQVFITYKGNVLLHSPSLTYKYNG